MQVRRILMPLIYKGLRLLSNLLPILKIGGSNPFERAKKFLVSSRRGISFLRRDSKDERDRATVRRTVATASDQAPAGARNRCGDGWISFHFLEAENFTTVERVFHILHMQNISLIFELLRRFFFVYLEA